MKTYDVVNRLKHDGKDYNAGESIKLEPEAAELLLSRGTITEKGKEPTKDSNMPEPKKVEPKKTDNPAKRLGVKATKGADGNE